MNQKIKLEKKERKLELKSGKYSVSKNGEKYELKHGPYSVTKEGENIGATTGGKNWRAKVYKGEGGSGGHVEFIKKFKKGGLVSKRTFIARGCRKVMNNRRKKTKIY